MKKLYAYDPLLYPPDEDAIHSKSLFIQQFFELIDQSIQPPYAISVDGLWGTGKTTVMRFLQTRFEKANYPVFWFNPWEYRQAASIVLAFLQCLAAAHKDSLQEISKSGAKILSVLIESGMDAGLKLITRGTLSLEDIKASFKSVEERQVSGIENYQNTIETIKKEFVELTYDISKKHDSKPVIIFFDDLDRCLPDDAIQLLEALKNLFVTPDCKAIFICGIDTHIAKQFISEHYSGIEETFSINYFRKIFNLTISMPYSLDLENLLRKHIKALYEWKDEDDRKASQLAKIVFTRGLQTQTYSIRKYLNIITNFYTFLKFNPEYEFNGEKDIIVNLLILKEAWQPLFENLIREALRERSDMKALVAGFLERNQQTPFLSMEQDEFLKNYFGDNTPFADEYLHQLLVDYPTLA